MWPTLRIIELGLIIGLLTLIKNELNPTGLCDAAHVGPWEAEPRREENSQKISFDSIDSDDNDNNSDGSHGDLDDHLKALESPDPWALNEVDTENEDTDMASSEAPPRHARQLGGPPRPTIFEQAGRAVNNLAGNLANGIAQQHGNVNRTLGNLDRGIERGSNGVQNRITTTFERHSRRLQGVVARITNFFHTSLGALGRIVNFLGNGFRQLILSIFNRSPIPPPPPPPPPPIPNLLARQAQEEGIIETVVKTTQPGGPLPVL